MQTALLSLLAVMTATDDGAPAKPGPLYIAVGYGGRRLSSVDGIHWDHDVEWKADGGDDDDCLFNVGYGRGKFVAVGGGARLGRIVVTRDGKTWRELPNQKSRVATIAFGGGRFVAGNRDLFLYSDDGEKWIEGGRLGFEGSVHFRRSAFGGGLFVAVGDVDPPGKPRTGFRAVTANGEKVGHFAPGLPVARDVAFGAGRFVVVGPDGLRESSKDGRTWEHTVHAKGEDLSRVVWTGRRFLVSGEGVAYSSPDGVTWTKEAKPIPCSLTFAGDRTTLGASWGGQIWYAVGDAGWKKAEVKPGNAIEAMAFTPAAE